MLTSIIVPSAANFTVEIASKLSSRDDTNALTRSARLIFNTWGRLKYLCNRTSPKNIFNSWDSTVKMKDANSAVQKRNQQTPLKKLLGYRIRRPNSTREFVIKAQDLASSDADTKSKTNQTSMKILANFRCLNAKNVAWNTTKALSMTAFQHLKTRLRSTNRR